MGKKNIAFVRRRDNARSERPLAAEVQPSNDTGKDANQAPLEKLYVEDSRNDTAWLPGRSAVLKMMFSLRLAAALWSTISDCDEVFNYWEPLHLLTHGKGMQTWEYSPLYAIRSYFYIYLHYIPANILSAIFPYSKIAVFVCMRCLLGIFCLVAEYQLFHAVAARLSISIARFYLLFSVLSTGLFISCTAFLPSTFSMVLNMFAMAAYLKERWFMAVLCTAISALVGWPFAAILGIPVAIHMLLINARTQSHQFFYFAVISFISVTGCLSSVDSYYYGKRVLAPLNIVLYNVFSGHGADLYGIEPISFYIKNLFLNWNIVLLLAPLGLPLCFLAYVKNFKSTDGVKKFLGLPLTFAYYKRMSPVVLLFLSMLSWCLVFFSTAHKEERFLYPIYPLLAIFAAIALDALERLLRQKISGCSSAVWLIVLAFLFISLSRAYSLHRNFGAHIEVYKGLNEHLTHSESLNFGTRQTPLRICVGKEWYRFPSSYFLPDVVLDKHGNKLGTELAFLKSEFTGLLPKYFASGSIPEVTRMIPTEMNDLNQEEVSRYVAVETCDYIIDVDMPSDMTTTLEPYFGDNTEKYTRLYSHPFLISPKSHWFFRAFYIPYFSHNYTTMTFYSLYKSK